MDGKSVILITGAGGFIGSAIAEDFSRSGFGSVRAGVGRPASAARLQSLSLEIVSCPPSAPALDAALKNVDVLIHCARNPLSEEATLAGTRLLLERAKAANVRRVLYMSSVATYGEAITGIVTEGTAAVPPLSAYGEGKRAGEALCRESATPDMRICALRPTLVYGPSSDLWTVPFVKRLASGKWPRLDARGEGRCNLVYISDVVAFCRFLIERDTGPFDAFNVNGPDVPTWNAYLEAFNAALGLPPLKPATPALGWKAALSQPARRLARYVRTRHPGLLDEAAKRSAWVNRALAKAQDDMRLQPGAEELARFSRDVVYSVEKASRMGFRPRVGLEEGVKLAADWARAQQLIP